MHVAARNFLIRAAFCKYDTDIVAWILGLRK
jgi:hypothetical protein